ncbi:two-component sensor histidine kinase, partial [Streptomyces sp. NPDC056230]
MSSERARLTALYGGLLVLAGALLVGLVYLLVSEGLYASVLTAVAPAVPPPGTPKPQQEENSNPTPLAPYA